MTFRRYIPVHLLRPMDILEIEAHKWKLLQLNYLIVHNSIKESIGWAAVAVVVLVVVGGVY